MEEVIEEVIIEWACYPNFFDLYNVWQNKPKLVYIIGETHHCYIGSVGSRGGVVRPLRLIHRGTSPQFLNST